VPIDLAVIQAIDGDVEDALGSLGRIVRAFRRQDSGCVSYIVEQGVRRYFVKRAVTARGAASLERARRLHASVRHEALPPLLNAVSSVDGPVHIYACVPGVVLYDAACARGEAGRRDPRSVHFRFRALPVERITAALDTIYDVHQRLAAEGFVAVDFYDGCILYDFEGHRTWLCDLDEYRPGPFVLEDERLPGSRRFMAPETLRRGALIGHESTVYSLARAAVELLSDGDLDSTAWRGTQPQREVLRRAIASDPAERFPTVGAFVAAWRLLSPLA
jgi:hypothetical protein